MNDDSARTEVVLMPPCFAVDAFVDVVVEAEEVGAGAEAGGRGVERPEVLGDSSLSKSLPWTLTISYQDYKD